MKKRHIALLGNSLILETLGESLKRFPQDEVIGFPAIGLDISGIADLRPEVIIFDLDSTRSHSAFSLLQNDPELVLIGVSSDSNLVKMWTGRQMREMSIRDLLKVIHKGIRNPPARSTHADEIRHMTRKNKKHNHLNNKS